MFFCSLTGLPVDPASRLAGIYILVQQEYREKGKIDSVEYRFFAKVLTGKVAREY